MRSDQFLLDDNIYTELASIEILGCCIKTYNAPYFEGLVRKSIISGTIDVTGWTREAVRILITVCREKDIQITVKNGNRYATIVRFPTSELLEPLITNIISPQ